MWWLLLLLVVMKCQLVCEGAAIRSGRHDTAEWRQVRRQLCQRKTQRSRHLPVHCLFSNISVHCKVVYNAITMSVSPECILIFLYCSATYILSLVYMAEHVGNRIAPCRSNLFLWLPFLDSFPALRPPAVPLPRFVGPLRSLSSKLKKWFNFI